MSTSRWKKGQSGNPAGRKAGSGEVAKLRSAITGEVPEILKALIRTAKTGDVQAARLLLERVLPPLRAIEEPVVMELVGQSLADQGRAVLAEAAAGRINTGQASAMLASLGTLAKIVESDELLRRVEALESKYGVKPKEER